MMALATTTPAPTLADLKQRLAALYDTLVQTERAVHADTDPAWTALVRLVVADLDAAQEALVQADLARTGGDIERAKRRLAVAWERLQSAGTRLCDWEAEHGS